MDIKITKGNIHLYYNFMTEKDKDKFFSLSLQNVHLNFNRFIGYCKKRGINISKDLQKQSIIVDSCHFFHYDDIRNYLLLKK